MRTAGRGPKEPGRLKELKAIGWYVEDYGIAQISCNLTDYHVTNMHTVYEECEKDARELNISPKTFTSRASNEGFMVR